MFRSYAIYCLAACPLLALALGCGGGSAEVAQAPAASESTTTAAPMSMPEAPSDGYDASSSEPSSTSESIPGGESMSYDGYQPPSDGGMYVEPQAYGSQGYGGAQASPLSKFGAMLGINLGGSTAGQGDGYAGASMGGYEMGAGSVGDGYGMPGQNNLPKIEPPPAEDADLLTKAKYAFSIGKEKEAVEYIRAYAVATEESGEVQQKTKWYAPSTQPATTIRFAVGVILEAPAALVDLKPIGSKQLQGGGGGGGMYGQPSNQTGNKERSFYSITGTFGEALVASFNERWTSGNLGSIFDEVTASKPKPVVPNNGMGMGSGMMSSGTGMEGYSGANDGYGSDGGMMGEGSGSKTQPSIMPGSVLTPGIVYIGTSDKQATLMEKAAQEQVDAVFLFDVTVSGPNRINGIVQNDARLRLVTMKGDLLARSSELLNTKVERALLTSTGDDEVKKAIDKFFAQFDEKVKLTELPAIKPEHAKVRLTQLLSSKEADKLQKLFEVSLFHSMKLISDEDRTTCYLIVMEGSAGEALASGALLDKNAVLEPLLPDYK